DEKEWATALGSGGALEALVEARSQGLVRLIGVTGHGSQVAAMHLRSLERFPFDSVLFPYNFTMLGIAPYPADFEALLKACRARAPGAPDARRDGSHGRPPRNRTTVHPRRVRHNLDLPSPACHTRCF